MGGTNRRGKIKVVPVFYMIKRSSVKAIRATRVCSAVRLRAGRQRNRASIPGTQFFFLPPRPLDRLCGPLSPFQSGPRLCPSAQGGRGVKLTTHLHLVPTLGTSGAILSLPPLAFMACIGFTYSSWLTFEVVEAGKTQGKLVA